MSKLAIHQYYQNFDRTLQFGKSTNEQSVRFCFQVLLNDYARQYNYEVVSEVSLKGEKGRKIRPDGVVKNLWGLDIGWWESKDEKDDIEVEIGKKVRQGYPLTNILFENTQVAILYQKGAKVKRVAMCEAEKLHDILTRFLTFKSETVDKFEEAIERFKADIPALVEKLRSKIDESSQVNANFKAAQHVFWERCKREINPDITLADIREMLIQHLLTSDIFTKVFADVEFHQHNTIAAELEKLIGTLFSYPERRNLLHSIEHYYLAINATAAAIIDHHEKQKFLKVLYENFYKVYNSKVADRLGVVYTPNEIVQFMVRSVDYLLDKHFGKTLADREVEILDPATGTGTFICEIIENAIPKQYLEYKFLNEIYANEVAILPYYIANLNIEYTFKQKMGYYAEFPNLCFVDTLDNVSALGYSNQMKDLFGLTSENMQRIKRQNERRISVIIGNPPYNANQLNENENNKNREYWGDPKKKTGGIDGRIRDTYVAHSTAQKTKVYDMYSRFYRWASDRIDQNGVLAFITNRSFIDSRTFDGFRKCLQEEFCHGYIIDLMGNIRENYGNVGVTIGNVFDIQVGVAIMFLIKKEMSEEPCRLEYVALPNQWRKAEKLEWLKTQSFGKIAFERLTPDKKHNWIQLAEDNDWESLLPVCAKRNSENVIFGLSSLGINTSRDEWVYDFDRPHLIQKMRYFHAEYNHERNQWIEYKQATGYLDEPSDSNPVVDKFLMARNLIKWSKMMKRDKLRKEKVGEFHEEDIVSCQYRPYTKKFLCDGYLPIDVRGHLNLFFHNHITGQTFENRAISIYGLAAKSFHCLATKDIMDLHFTGDSQCLPFYHYNEEGKRFESITKWGLEQFRTHYQDPKINKRAIFHYIYAVLHNPAYRQKYELNLKRDFPRLPFYSEFWQWVTWGKTLMDLHLNYETVKKYPLQCQDLTGLKNLSGLKVKLKANKVAGHIEIDEQTTLQGVPETAWEYKLGNRSALEWILDQYKEKKISDPTIAEHFDTYRFADYKEHVIELLQRVCTVSVKTMEIIKQMENVKS